MYEIEESKCAKQKSLEIERKTCNKQCNSNKKLCQRFQHINSNSNRNSSSSSCIVYTDQKMPTKQRTTKMKANEDINTNTLRPNIRISFTVINCTSFPFRSTISTSFVYFRFVQRMNYRHSINILPFAL